MNCWRYVIVLTAGQILTKKGRIISKIMTDIAVFSHFEFLFIQISSNQYHSNSNQMENILRTQQSQKSITQAGQKIYPRLSTREEQEVNQEFEQTLQDFNKVNHENFQLRNSKIINKPNLDQNIRYCRICLQGELPQAKLLFPCNCSNGAHDTCLLEWLRHRQLINNKNGMKCQVCLSSYAINIIQNYCFTFQMCKKQNQKFVSYFALQVLIFLILLILTGLSLFFLFKINISEDFATQAQKMLDLPKNSLIVLAFISLLFSGVLSICLGCRIVYNFCYGVETTLIEQNRQ